MATPISKQTYTPSEQTEITQWLTTTTRLSTSSPTEQTPLLTTLNTHLSTRTFLLGTKPSSADEFLYTSLASQIPSWTADQKTGKEGYPHIIRHLDFVQNSPVFKMGVGEEEKVKIGVDEVLYFKPPVDAKAEKERLKKEKAAASTSGGGEQTVLADRTNDGKGDKSTTQKLTGKAKEAKNTVVAAVTGEPSTPKKEKKEKAPKQPQKAPATSAPLSPSLIDLRVGHILQAIKHPEADSLYVSTIAMGDDPSTPDTTLHTPTNQTVRTVCSGLNGLIPLSEMQDRKVIVVCNLKPVKMRGIKSCAMLLAASPRLKEGEEDKHEGPVELVEPPEGAKAGERVWFEGWKGEPEGTLNPKKKVWEMCQVGFTTTEERELGFDAGVVKELSRGGEEPKMGVGRLVTKSGGVCTVKSLKGAVVR